MVLHPRTQATIEQLERAEWFANVGRNVGISQPDKVILLSGWKEAVEHCTSDIWDNLVLEANNQYHLRVARSSPERYQFWNELVEFIKPVAYELSDRKIADIMARENLPRGFQGCVRTDVLGILIEAELADVVPPGFYAANGYWYIKGHFPCGWVGDTEESLPPHGKLVIY